MGLAVAAGIYFSDLRSGALPAQSPAAARTVPSREPAPEQAAPERAASRPADTRAAASAPVREAAAGAADDGRPRFEFYEILPEYEVVIPEVETVTEASGPSTPSAPIETPGSYVLQTGSFRSHADADRMQASLALLGIESRIQRVTIDDDEFHRVRVGPISDLDELNRIRNDLERAGVESLTMKVSE